MPQDPRGSGEEGSASRTVDGPQETQAAADAQPSEGQGGVELPAYDPGSSGPGLRPRPGVDPSLVAATVFVALGWVPLSVYRSVLGVTHFGPLELPAIMAMVGLLSAVIGVLRAVDLKDAWLRNASIVVGAVAFVRLFLVPLLPFGW